MADRPEVVVIGSAHMDLIASASRLPGPGESVSGGHFSMSPGGKAGNQAVQFARAGIKTSLITRLGDDLFGRELLQALGRCDVDTSSISIDQHNATGASTVFVAEGDYSSIIAPGAAALLSPGDIELAADKIRQADAVVLQLELPVNLSIVAAELAGSFGRMVVLNASPMPETVGVELKSLLGKTSILVVNRVEAGQLLRGDGVTHPIVNPAEELGRRFGIDRVVVTLGTQGSISYLAGHDTICQDVFPVDVVDPVGAGDAFLAVFVSSILLGISDQDALRRASAAGAIVASKAGAFDSAPTNAEIDLFLGRHVENSSRTIPE